METPAQWEKRLRRDQPRSVFFIDDDMREPLQRAAAREGVTVAAWIKKSLKMRLNDERG